VISIFLFTLVYWISSFLGSGLIVDSNTINLDFSGLVESLYASLLISTIFGFSEISGNLFQTVIIYFQFALSIILVLILIDKLLQKYVFPTYHIHHNKDKKINTMTLTMSIFRSDIERLKAEFKAKTKQHVNIRDIESIVDGLYITFLDIDKMFGSKNVHKKYISDRQYLIILTNIEDSLHTLSKFIDFLTNHKIEWKDKHINFWINHILDTAEKVTMHFDEVKTRDHKMIIAVENIKDYVETIRKKI
jgi:hypothetical protein